MIYQVLMRVGAVTGDAARGEDAPRRKEEQVGGSALRAIQFLGLSI